MSVHNENRNIMMIGESGPITRRERTRVMDRFKETVKNQRPMNVIVIGTAGVGKSSFLNTVMTSFSDKHYWIERAGVGNYENVGKQETYHLNSFSKDKYITRWTHESFAYPTLLDIAGLEDEDSLVLQEMLRIVLFGRIHEGESLQTLHRFISENVHNVNVIREQYSTVAEEHRVDRIIFVASAHADTHIPTKLINVVRSAANSSEMVIPRYGVLTHCDQVDVEDEDFFRKEKDFKAHLGLPDNRYMRCRNYCDDIDRVYGTNRLDETIPEIDIPVIKFMTQVCNPGFVTPDTKATYHKQTPTSTTSGSTRAPGTAADGSNNKSDTRVDPMWVFLGIVIVLVAIILAFIASSKSSNYHR